MIYVHVGFPKVASTTIQRFLSRNETFLATKNFVYPRLTKPGQDQLGVSANAHNALAIELRRGDPGVTFRRLRRLLADRPAAHHVVVSGEGLSGCKPQELREALGGAEAAIICYVREFASIVTSQYAHATKIGLHTEGFDQFFDRTLARPNFDLAKHLGRWAAVFGEPNIRVRMLDERTLARGDVRFDILEALDIDVSGVDEAELEMTGSVNQALGWKTVEILRDLHTSLSKLFVANESRESLVEARRNRHRRIDSPLFDFTSSISGPASKIGLEMGFTDKGKYLNADQFARCNDAFNAQVDALRATGMKLSLAHASEKGFTPRPFLPSVEEIPPAEIAEFLRRLAPLGWWKLLSGGRRADMSVDEDD